MKKHYFIIGTYLQFQVVDTRRIQYFCLVGENVDVLDIRNFSFKGELEIDEDNSLTGKVSDKYGVATIQGAVTRDESGKISSLNFDKDYEGISASTIRYALQNNDSDLPDSFAGHFEIDKAPEENNGWAKCQLIEMEKLFDYSLFEEEMLARKKKYNSK